MTLAYEKDRVTLDEAGRARRVLANLEAHRARGEPLTAEARAMLAEYDAAMRRPWEVGDRVALNANGEYIRVMPNQDAVGRIMMAGPQGGQISFDGSPGMLLSIPHPARHTSFVQEYLNEPWEGPDAMATPSEPRPPRRSELPPMNPPMSREQEAAQARLREHARQQRLARERAAREQAQRAAQNPPPATAPNPVQHAEEVVTGRPKRRVLRKKR